MSLALSETKASGEQWSEFKREFIQNRDDLLKLAERGTDQVYRAIAADWTTVWPARMFAPTVNYPAKKTTFEKHEGSGHLELTTYDLLTRCHALFAELKRQFIAARGTLDTMGLTYLERKYLKSH